MKVIKITKPKQRRGAAKDPFYVSKVWRKFRLICLAEQPLCVMCLAEGIIKDADMVDHVQQISQGGARLDKKNTQNLCNHHHAIKRAEESKRNRAI